ncbi:MAG: DNA polymerase subunit beta [Methanomicrobiales archaeon]|nr:DNA polymerase subunit beta [Methanomicrobiales archaeon]
MMPVRLRDFVEDADGWLYAVSTYDNEETIGTVLRYVPQPDGNRVHPTGKRYQKYDFEEAYAHIAKHKPQYAGLLHRIPHADVKRVYKPDLEIDRIAATHPRVKKLVNLFGLPHGTIGCTGSLLCQLDDASSDIDMVVYGRHWFVAQELVRNGIRDGVIEGLSESMWRKVYEKRKPEISYADFVIHEQRKFNRGQVDGTYFDILYTRSYDGITSTPAGKGEVLGKATIEAEVTDASLAFDNPAVYYVRHETVNRVLSFTHTYSGQALAGETIEACGVLEKHGPEHWLIVGTTREARGEYIVSKTLLDQ